MNSESAPVFAKGRDLEATAATLERWLAPKLGDDAIEVRELSYPSGSGVSNETILFEAQSGASGTVDELVLRTAPAPEYQLFLDPDLRAQFDLLATIRRLGTVRVPEVLWYEEDPTVLGQPFFLMRRMHGRVPVSMPVYNAAGWLVDATPEQRRTAWLSAMHQFAAIHTLPLGEVAFVGDDARGATGIDQLLSYWSDHARWVLEGEEHAVVETLFEWLRSHAPSDEPTGLAWGDARIGNMMFDDDFEVVGVMDWEQASLGGAMSDLGWWLFFDDVHSVDYGVARLDGLGTRQETIDLWETLTGRTAGDVRWHEVFAGLKVGVLAIRTLRVLTLMGVTDLPQSSPMIYFRRSCRLAGLPDPGEPT